MLASDKEIMDLEQFDLLSEYSNYFGNIGELDTPEDVKRRNRELCERYPFLIPSNRFSGRRITEGNEGGFWPGTPAAVPKYDYEFTELDDMPDGWRKAFGEQMCDEIMKELVAADLVDTFRIVQIKEKYGSLRFYFDGGNKAIGDIVSKYEEMSVRTCLKCGAPATRITTGWISPWCDVCAPTNTRSVPIEEFYKEDSDN